MNGHHWTPGPRNNNARQTIGDGIWRCKNCGCLITSPTANYTCWHVAVLSPLQLKKTPHPEQK